MTAILLIASLSAPPSPELLAMHRRDVAQWWVHTPAEDRAWRELARPPAAKRVAR